MNKKGIVAILIVMIAIILMAAGTMWYFAFNRSGQRDANFGNGGAVDSGAEGIVNLGPTCPVERIPPDPKCAPRPYQTKIIITSNAHFAKIIQSDADGHFRVNLESGTYVFTAGGGEVYPRCLPVNVTVKPNNYTPVTISCDTGIR